MSQIPIVSFPSYVEGRVGLDLWARAEIMVNQFHPLPPIFAVSMTDQQWALFSSGQAPDVARMPVQFATGTVIVLPFDGIAQLNGGLPWELASINMGWWYSDDPLAQTPAEIGPGPQYGMGQGAPDYLVADALFLSGSWEWLLFA
jgi:hypothetical protein